MLKNCYITTFFGFVELCSICQLTTEFHFPPIDDQLEKIRENVKEAVAWRQAHQIDEIDFQVCSKFWNLKYRKIDLY